ncbi:exported hypothetical protein [Desulfamplus magnetovallimortis]|uniref:ABC transporter substrate-binding protein n=1 Tax=Desulfamplus magnetovallimortis TaxID=1246637 RepID=A0A1W1HFC1_9BACT|nr:ABC transporter substrate binding protein [Desulfamplus magnetovallimortis]SLM31170.1 exported hypothetical protein [Desulfamplus magnetovallimortis]
MKNNASILNKKQSFLQQIFMSPMVLCILMMILLPAVTTECSDAKYKILALQHQVFGSYTAAYKGFLKGLDDSDIRGMVSVENYNAEKNMAILEGKIKDIKEKNSFDLLFTMGTQSTKKASDIIQNIPIVFTVVGSPVNSGIISNWKSSGSNVTGIATPNQVLKGITQIYELSKFTKIGITYLKGSPSHEAVLSQIKAMCKKNGIKFIYDGFSLTKGNGDSLSNDEIRFNLKKSLDTVLPQVDAMYVQASGTYEKNFYLFRNAFKKHQTPSFGDPIYIKKGIIVGIGVNDYAFGQQAAEYAVKILKGTPPSALPMDTGTKFSILVNLEAAQMVQLDPLLLMPIMNSADAIYQKITE